MAASGAAVAAASGATAHLLSPAELSDAQREDRPEHAANETEGPIFDGVGELS